MQLTTDARAVIVLRHFGDLSYDQIAETLGVPSKTVKSHLHSARQKLGEQLLGGGHADDQPPRRAIAGAVDGELTSTNVRAGTAARRDGDHAGARRRARRARQALNC